MQDESGVAMYSEYSGRTVFLRGVSAAFVEIITGNTEQIIFTQQDLMNAFKLDDCIVNQTEKWLFDNAFIEQI